MHHEGAQLSVVLYAHHTMVRRLMLYYAASAGAWVLLSLERQGQLCIGTHTLIPLADIASTRERLDLVVQQWLDEGHTVDVRRLAGRQPRREPT